MNSRPVHWLVSGHVAGRVRTACGRYDFESDVQPDSDRDEVFAVTCPECLLAMTTPIVVDAAESK